jgi:hypothetical protein
VNDKLQRILKKLSQPTLNSFLWSGEMRKLFCGILPRTPSSLLTELNTGMLSMQGLYGCIALHPTLKGQ